VALALAAHAESKAASARTGMSPYHGGVAQHEPDTATDLVGAVPDMMARVKAVEA
jgi:hypothetical protein